MYIDLSALNEGITQDKRHLQALMPDFIDVDERDADALLKTMAEFSALFTYYDINNVPQGNWEDFFRSDVHVLLVIITSIDMLAYIDQYSALQNELYLAEDDEQLYEALRKLFDFVTGIVNLLADLRNRLVAAAAGSNIVTEINTIVESFDAETASLISYNREAAAKFNKDISIEFPDYFLNLESTSAQNFIFNNGSTPAERVLNALPQIKNIFTNLGTKFNNLLGIASFYHQNYDMLTLRYQPHMALCAAFVHLYTNLQQRLNVTTKNHLDFFYKRILGMETGEPEPDTVNLIFEKDPSSADVLLAAGEELLAKVEGQPEPVVFKLDRDVMVSNTQIASLKTLIVIPHEQVNNDKGVVTEFEVYDGSYPVVSAAAHLKNKLPEKPWPVFGEDQENLPDADKNMQMSSMGLLISSPVLYQPEGRRNIRFEINLSDESFDWLMDDYFANYAAVNRKDLMAAAHQLLADAFVIDYTDTKGWKAVGQYTALLDVAERKLNIDIDINNSDEFIDVYNPLTHGGNFDTAWPIFRLLLNNYAVNNPYTFLQQVKMDRITIIANVKGSRAVKLQNAIGPLSAASTSQLFGPQPSVGSYLDIKSSNIFNKYTQTFCIRFDWIDLPVEPGGWETYYKAYNNNITNRSFQVKLSTLNDGKFIPKPAEQQQMALFESEDDGTLKASTQLQNIDMKRLYFNKKPMLDKQDNLPDKNFSEGALRIELVAPKDAFGHKLFPQIFPQVVLYNARHSKKLDLPNQPYIPVMRSVSIDYTLQDSEALGVKDKNDEECDLKIYHQYPFGYTSVYPGMAKAPYHLIPYFDQNNNLFIGLVNIKPGQLLTMLFQLREDNYSNLSEAKTMWSYLDNNQWINLNDEQVLFDGTNSFVNSGIVALRLPDNFRTGNTMLPPDLYWLRASSKNNIKSNVRGIYTQAAAATRQITSGDVNLNLPPGIVKTFKRKVIGIQSITQPFQSAGGKPAETDAQYYVRVSERLRHGQRLVTSRDIELAILEQFPEIYIARCIDESAYSQAYIKKYRPGLRVILVPVNHVNGIFATQRPSVNLATRYRVNKFLTQVTQPFLNIQVKSPVYETIKVICAVTFNADSRNMADTGSNITRLNDDIKRYLCPWLFDKSAPFKIGSGIYMVELFNFIKNLPYIKDVSDFSIAHFYFDESADGDGLKARVNYSYSDNVYISGSLPQSVLIPNKKHLITIVGNQSGDADKKIGISEFAVMDELLVDMDDSADVITDGLHNDIRQTNDDKSFFDLIIAHDLD